MADNILSVRNLSKSYVVNKRQNNVICNVSFDIREGEMVAVMGPSGSGKSTLLYTVSGMDSATAGSVNFCGKEIQKLNAKAMSKVRLNDMGFIFQQMYMLKNLSIFDNIVLPAYESGKEKRRKVINRRAEMLMRKLGIMEVAGNSINEVSGGQLQRACICRSMINNPRIIFADEPTGALNRQSSAEVMDELGKINREGSTIMMVTHDAKVASRCERIFYLEDGGIRGELNLEKYSPDKARERERKVTHWLSNLGW